MAQPFTSHWLVVKRILFYFSGTIDFGVVLELTSLTAPLSLHTFCDADWTFDIYDTRLTSSVCVYLGTSWWSKKQSLVAQSSAEAKYYSLTLATSKVCYGSSLCSMNSRSPFLHSSSIVTSIILLPLITVMFYT